MEVWGPQEDSRLHCPPCPGLWLAPAPSTSTSTMLSAAPLCPKTDLSGRVISPFCR